MDVETIIEYVLMFLSDSRNNECTLATSLLMVGICYFMAKGVTVTYKDKVVVHVKRVVGNVTTKAEDGTSSTVGHWWIRLGLDGCSKDENIDLTAKQFYPKLPSTYTADPEKPPLSASIVGNEAVTGMPCGESVHDPHTYADPTQVISVFATHKPEMARYIYEFYNVLRPHM